MASIFEAGRDRGALAAAVASLLPGAMLAHPLGWLPALAVAAWCARSPEAAAPRPACVVAVGASVVVLLRAALDGTPIDAATLALVVVLWGLAQLARARATSEDPGARRHRAVAEQSGTLALVLGPDDRVRYANPALRSHLGTNGSLVGMDVASLLRSEDRAALRDGLRRIRRTDALPLNLPPLEFTPTSAEGPPVRLELRLAPLGDGEVLVGGREPSAHGETTTRRTDTRFSNLFAASHDALLIRRASDGISLDFNAAFSRLSGFSRDEGLGVPVERLFRLADPDDSARFMKLLDRDGEVVQFETELVTRDGRTREVSIAGRHGEVDGEACIVTVIRDVSDSRRTQHALAESEQRFSRIFHRSPDAMVITRLIDGVVLDVNERFCDLFDVERADIAGRPFTDNRPARGGLALGGHQQAASSAPGEAPLIAELEFRVDDVTVPTLLSTTVAEIDGEECAITVIRDLRALREAQAQKAESEARFRGAFEHAPIGMLLVDPADDRILQVNPRLCEMLGRDSQELVGTLVEAHVHEADRAEHRAFQQDLLAGRAEMGRTEHRVRRADGEVLWTDRHLFVQRDEDARPRLVIQQVADITEMKQSQERMRKLAFYDTLTDLANRRLFADRLEQAARHSARTGQCSALLYLDLDNFKRVNDTLGHEAGDELLRTVARRLRSCVREEDTVGRPGGDEFTLLLNEVRGARAAGKVARKILDALADPIQLGEQEVRVTTSIGITLAPEDGVDPQVLTRNADLAMYRAKERGRDNYQFFAEEMNSRARERLEIENGLRAALADRAFHLVYQAQFDLQSQEIVGVEALLRWAHPERGLLTPAEFMQVADETGLICEIGDLALRDACLAAQRLRRISGRPLTMAVNLSARQFAESALVERVRRALRDAELEPDALVLEITETLLLGQDEGMVRTLDALREMGVRLSVDDFGTGHSSLSDLKRLPMAEIKIDRRFVAELPNSDDAAIISAIIAMAHRLNLRVVAEGVETSRQRVYLEAQGCDRAQGYLLGALLPLQDLIDDLTQTAALSAPDAARRQSPSGASDSQGT